MEMLLCIVTQAIHIHFAGAISNIAKFDPFEVDLHHLKFAAWHKGLHGGGIPDPRPDSFAVPENKSVTGSPQHLGQYRQRSAADARFGIRDRYVADVVANKWRGIVVETG